MNGSYFNFDRVVFESFEDIQNKRDRLKKLFSRVFLALFIYTIISQLFSTVVYIGAAILLPEEQYALFADNYVVALLVSTASQYLVAFPILALMMRGVQKAQTVEKSKLSLKDLFLLFLIAELLMYVGNLIGQMLNNVFGALMGQMPENDVATIISSVPMWLLIMIVVVIGPIVEELIFRKLMIDRLSLYGDRMAILFTSVAFGLIHANLYQFFYATLIGVLLGYVYTRTRDVRYTIVLHMILNFMGSILVLYVEKSATEFYNLLELSQLGEAYDVFAMLAHGLILLLYANMQYGMIAGGVFVLWHFIKKKRIHISLDKEISVSNKDIIKYGIVNTGAILFIVTSLLFTVLSLFT